MTDDEQDPERLSPEWWAQRADRVAQRRVDCLAQPWNQDAKFTDEYNAQIAEQRDLAAKMRELAELRIELETATKRAQHYEDAYSAAVHQRADAEAALDRWRADPGGKVKAPDPQKPFATHPDTWAAERHHVDEREPCVVKLDMETSCQHPYATTTIDAGPRGDVRWKCPDCGQSISTGPGLGESVRARLRRVESMLGRGLYGDGEGS